MSVIEKGSFSLETIRVTAYQKTTNLTAFVTFYQRVGKILSLKMEVAAWDQFSHLLFGQLFFFSQCLENMIKKEGWR